MRLAGKVALVAGTSSGIGRAVAIALAAEGAAVVPADVRTESHLPEEQRATVELIRHVRGRPDFVRCDVSRPANVEALVRHALDAFGGLDVLVPDDEWAHVLGINLRRCFLACLATIPIMIQRGLGAIMNVRSIHGLLGTPGAATYCASKGAFTT